MKYMLGKYTYKRVVFKNGTIVIYDASRIILELFVDFFELHYFKIVYESRHKSRSMA